ncbi:MAG: aminoacyl-tRNA hydrolase [Planctomycetota bacterium]|nr:aminoacyl-tRNA hydrolase [Planctomycetota bacterium]
MKLVVGLGNPGAQYSGTRHNAGFDVVLELVRRYQPDKPQSKFSSEIWEIFVGSGKLLLVTPTTYMNRSGEAVQQITRFYQISPQDVAVVCDDINLPMGRIRWRAGGSAGGQKGLADIIQRLGTDQIPRLRMGVGRPPGQMDAADFVLSRFRAEERAESKLMTKIAADSIDTWIADGVSSAMNRFNRLAEE